jgi:hypothetical protein
MSPLAPQAAASWSAPPALDVHRGNKFAYHLFSRTIMRSTYGLFWIPADLSQVVGSSGAPAWLLSAPMVTALNGGVTPFNTLDNPFPKVSQISREAIHPPAHGRRHTCTSRSRNKCRDAPPMPLTPPSVNARLCCLLKSDSRWAASS